MEENKTFDIDAALKELQAINEKLASDIPLNEAMELYKKGVEISAKCQAHLESVEKELIKVN